MVCGANSQATFSRVRSGSCGSVSGRIAITDIATCESAARSLGISTFHTTVPSTTTAYITNPNNRIYNPPGCYWSKSERAREYRPPRYSENLYYNPKSSSTFDCASNSGNPEFCICVSAPECTQINGNEQNSAGDSSEPTGCICGTKFCAVGPPCLQTSGITANPAACQCDSVECTSDSGFYCDTSSSSRCTDVFVSRLGTCNVLSGICSDVFSCSQSDGTTPNTATCQCGPAECNTNSGFYCYKSSHGAGRCDTVAHSVAYSMPPAICSSVSGRAAITDKTMCETAAKSLGLSDTTASQESSSSYPSCARICVSAPECTRINGNEPNNAICICGTTACTANTGFYCTTSESTCSPGPPCSQNDGTATNLATCMCGPRVCSTENGLFCFKSNNGAARCDKVAHSTAYSILLTGYCTSVSGRGDISDQTSCMNAARSLGLDKTTTLDISEKPKEPPRNEDRDGNAMYIPGCTIGETQHCSKDIDRYVVCDSSPTLYYNTDRLYATEPCSSSNACLCITAPGINSVCKHIDGITPNTAEQCFCGKNTQKNEFPACRCDLSCQHVGSNYCKSTDTKNYCTDKRYCEEDTINQEGCQCGQKYCIEDQYCSHQFSECSTGSEFCTLEAGSVLASAFGADDAKGCGALDKSMRTGDGLHIKVSVTFIGWTFGAKFSVGIQETAFSAHLELFVESPLKDMAILNAFGDLFGLRIIFEFNIEQGQAEAKSDNAVQVCEFPKIGVKATLQVGILPEITSTSKLQKQLGKLSISLFDLLEPTGNLKSAMDDINVKCSIVFTLDKLYSGGFQASVQLIFGLGKWGATSPQLAAGLDLVDMFGISSKDCESSSLVGKKCFVVGEPENTKCEAIDVSSNLNQEHRRGMSPLVIGVSAAAAAVVAAVGEL